MALDKLDALILHEIVAYQKKQKGLDLSDQLQLLRVTKRELTGFGIFVHFDETNQKDLSTRVKNVVKYLSSPAEIYVDTLEFQISFELKINDLGQFEFLEIVPNGVDSWNGGYSEINKK